MIHTCLNCFQKSYLFFSRLMIWWRLRTVTTSRKRPERTCTPPYPSGTPPHSYTVHPPPPNRPNRPSWSQRRWIWIASFPRTFLNGFVGHHFFVSTEINAFLMVWLSTTWWVTRLMKTPVFTGRNCCTEIDVGRREGGAHLWKGRLCFLFRFIHLNGTMWKRRLKVDWTKIHSLSNGLRTFWIFWSRCVCGIFRLYNIISLTAIIIWLLQMFCWLI